MKNKYEITLRKDNTYSLFFDIEIPSGIMEKATEIVAKTRGWIIPLEVDEFVASEGLNFVQSRIKKQIKQVERQVKADIPSFKIVSAKVENVYFSRSPDGGWRARVYVTGVFSS